MKRCTQNIHERFLQHIWSKQYLKNNYFSDIRRLCVFAIFATFQISFAYSQTTSLTSQVLDAATHQPIANAVIVLHETGQSKITNEDGRFDFKQLFPGRHIISVHHLAYANVERSIFVSTNQNDTLIILLRPTLLWSDEVIIRSTRTSSTINNTPFPLDVETNDHLIQTSNVTISDILNRVPGVALVRDGTWETAVSIRGMSPKNIVSLIDNTRIETATDIAGALSLVNINDIERVEILKSPGSVLYGTGALGGVLHLVTKRSSFTDQLQIKAELTNSISSVNDGLSHFVAVEGSSNRYALRMSGGYRNAGNTTTPNGVLPNSQYHDFSLSGSLGIRTFDDQSLFITYQRSQAENTGIPGASAFGTSAVVRYTLARRELVGLEYNIPNISSTLPLVSIRFSHQKIDRNVESRQGDTLKITPHAIHTTTSFQIESNIYPAANHLLVVGAEAWQRELDSQREKSLLDKNKIIGERPVPSSRFFSGGIYAQDEWTIVPHQLTSTLGVRYDWIRISNDKVYNPEYSITSGVLKINSADSTILWKNGSAYNESWSANAGVQYSFNTFLDFTLLVATAFRSPSLEERYQFIDLGNGNLQVGNPNLQPERSLCLNTGFRVHTEGLKIQTDLFLNQLKNLIKGVPGIFEGRSVLINTNIAEARLYGYEFSCEKTLTTWSVLKASLAYIRGENTYTHANLPQIAPLTMQVDFSAYLQYIGTLSLSGTGTDSQENLAQGEIRTPGYTVFDVSFVSIPWNFGRLYFIVRSGIQNIFDKAYQNHLSTLRGIIKDEPGRNYFLSTTIAI
jgi:hemoglobin/transferrin/lactoferrin receptor protein